MWSHYQLNLGGAEVQQGAKYVDHQAGATVVTLMDNNGKQAKTTNALEEMLRRESFPLNDDDQY